jgi:hypothetical protein
VARRTHACRKDTRELLNAALGVPDNIGSTGSDLGGLSSADPEDYCIEGVPRDFFVPLESELTENSDQFENSWRHYLERARDTAARSDELANQLLSLQKEQAYHTEEAQTAFANTCGRYGNISPSMFVDGKPSFEAGNDDATVRQCLEEEKFDFLFLSQDPGLVLCGNPEEESRSRLGELDPDETEDECFRRVVMDCPNTGHPLCMKAGPIEHAGMDLFPFELNQTEEVPEDCGKLAGMVESLVGSGFNATELAVIGENGWRNTATMLATINAIKLVVDDEGDWKVTDAGTPIMDSSSTSPLWPGCLANMVPCDPSAASAPAGMKVFDRIFRDSGAALTAEEKTRLLWRVQGGLWMLAGLAGKAHRGLFEVPYPAVNYGVAGAGFAAPAPTLFGAGRFSGGSLLAASGPEGVVTQADVAALKQATEIQGWNLRYEHAVPRPAWLSGVYASAGSREKFLHVRAVSPERTFHAAPTEFQSFLSVVGNGLANVKCEGGFTAGISNSEGDAATLTKLAGLKGHANHVMFNGQVGSTWTICGEPFTRPIFRVTSLPTYVGSDVNVTPTLELIDQYIAAPPPGASILFYVPAPVDDTYPLLAYTSPFQGRATHISCDGHALDLTEACATNAENTPQGAPTGQLRLTRHSLRPTACSADLRSVMITNTYPPNGACDGAAQLTRALTMACMLNSGTLHSSTDLAQVPEIRTAADIPALRRWMASIASVTKRVAASMYMDSVPKRVLSDTGGAGSASYQGTKGQQIFELGQALRNIGTSWATTGDQLSMLSGYVDQLQIDFDNAKIVFDEKRNAIAMSRLQIAKEIAGAIADGISGMAQFSPLGTPSGQGLQSIFSGSFFFNPVQQGAAAVNAAVQVGFSLEMLDVVSAQEINAADSYEVALRDAINRFVLSSIPTVGGIKQSLDGVEGSVNQALERAGAIEFSEDTALYQAANAAGAAYVVIDGETVDLPVNRTLREHADIYKRRYDRTVREARFLAYYARLAIEQRIAMRLNAIQTSVGGQEPPAVWADDICGLKGINYNTLTGFDIDLDDEELLESFTPDEDFETKMSKASLDAAKGDRSLLFIGDYVNRLENFVSFYNIEYPSKDGEDVAVLSLKDDLLATSTGLCAGPSRNLLYNSGALGLAETVDDGAGGFGVQGWETNQCDEQHVCLAISGGDSLSLEAPEDGGVTWLRDEEIPIADTGVGDFDFGETDNPLAPRAVFQRVDLQAGAYGLSWWDQARDLVTGQETHTASEAYRVTVQDSAGVTLVAFNELPMVSQADAGARWSPRRTVSFLVQTPGVHYVSFGASSTAAGRGSVAIANVQLERLSSIAAVPKTYSHTTSSLTVVTNECGSSDLFRRAFAYRCEAGRCYYDLMTPVIIDTRAVQSGFSRLSGKLASGNFNFRHVTAALNIVGTGVIDCAGNPSADCFSNNWVEYTLQHVAFSTPLLDHNGEERRFNFGQGTINNAKALTSERVITQPIGSADQQLLGQPQFTKPELGGRPLSGVYRFRIYDKPSLVWNQIEDIQVVLHHRYWSRVERQPPN